MIVGQRIDIKLSIKNQIKWLRRDAGYVLWMFAEQAATLAVPRLVLFPLAAYFVGKEQFGVFMTALSVALILGTQPGNGLAMGLLKHLSDYPEWQRAQLCGTALRMCRLAMAVIVALAFLVIAVTGVNKLAPWEVLNYLFPLVISLYPENQFLLILAENRFNRRFRGQALWSLLRSASVLLCGLAGVLVGGAIGLAWGFAAGNTITYAAVWMCYRERYQTSYNPEMGRVLKTVWFQMAIAGVIVLSGPYLNRIILSVTHSYGDTADLVAATSVMFMFSVPVTCLGGLLLNMISRYSSVGQFTVRGKVLYFLTLLFGITVMPFALKLSGPFISHIMFPKFGEASAELFGILSWVIPADTVTCLSRPIVIKFATIRMVPIINSLSMAATLTSSIFLVPSYAVKGAALAVAAGSIVSGILWGLGAIWVFYRKPLLRTKEIQQSVT